MAKDVLSADTFLEWYDGKRIPQYLATKKDSRFITYAREREAELLRRRGAKNWSLVLLILPPALFYFAPTLRAGGLLPAWTGDPSLSMITIGLTVGLMLIGALLLMQGTSESKRIRDTKRQVRRLVDDIYRYGELSGLTFEAMRGMAEQTFHHDISLRAQRLARQVAIFNYDPREARREKEVNDARNRFDELFDIGVRFGFFLEKEREEVLKQAETVNAEVYKKLIARDEENNKPA